MSGDETRDLADALALAPHGARCEVEGFNHWRSVRGEVNGWIQEETGFCVTDLYLANMITTTDRATPRLGVTATRGHHRLPAPETRTQMGQPEPSGFGGGELMGALIGILTFSGIFALSLTALEPTEFSWRYWLILIGATLIGSVVSFFYNGLPRAASSRVRR